MALRIKLKNSVVQDRVPTASDLPEVGELAVNANINSIGGFMRASDNSVVKIFGPGSLSTPTATTTVSGISELATNSETTTGTATNRVVTPAGLNAVTVAERSTSNSTYLALAGGTLTGVLAATAGSNSAPAIHFGDSDSGIFGGTNTVSLAAGGTLGLSILETSVRVPTKLGINGAAPQTPLDIIANGSGYAMAVRGRSADDLSQIRFTSNDYGTIFAELESDATYLATRIGGSEKLRVDSLGRFLVGTSSSRGVGETTQKLLQIEGVDASTGFSIVRNGANTAPPFLSFGKQRSGSVGGNTIVQQGDQLGQINFSGADGTDLVSNAASISSFVDGTPGSNDMPGRLVFSTTADGAASPTERLRIDSAGLSTFAGNLTIANNAPRITFTDNNHNSDYAIIVDGGDLNIQDTTNSANRLNINSSGVVSCNNGLDVTGSMTSTGNLTITNTQPKIFLTDSNNNSDFSIQNENGNFNIFDETNSVSRVRIVADGKVGIGKTSPSFKVDVAADNTSLLRLTNTNETGHGSHNCRFGAGGSKYQNLELFASSYLFRTFDGSSEDTRMTIDSSGNVGIGTTSPGGKLSVFDSSSAVFRLETPGVIAISHTFDGTDYTIANNDGSSGHPIIFGSKTSGGEAMRIDSSGNVGINQVPTRELSLHSPNNNNALIHFTNDDTGETSADGILVGLDGNENMVINNQETGKTINFYNGGSERMRIDSSGNVGIGNTSPASFDDYADLLVVGTTSGNNGITIVAGSSNYSSIYFADGTSGGSQKNAGIVDYNHSTDTMRFATAANNAMIIDSSGNLVVGGTSAQASDSATLMADGEVTAAGFYFSNNIGSAMNNTGIRRATTNTMVFDTDSTERMRIDSAGNVGIGVSAMDARLHVVNAHNLLNMVVATSNTFTGNASLVSFRSVSSEGGFISLTNNGTTCAYGTSSDYRLKENATTISDGITRLKTLKPYRFNFKTAPDTTVDGFFAHEVTAVPEAVIGEKDGEQMQGLDYAKLTPLLTAALQEAITKIETLETKVAALEAA